MFDYGPYKCWWHIRKIYDQLALLLAWVAALRNSVTAINNQTILTGKISPDVPGDFIGQVYIRTVCYALFQWDGAAWQPIPLSNEFTVPTLVELRQIPTQTCPPVFAKTFGRDVVGDDQPADYRWDANSMDVPADLEDISTVLPNDRTLADPGRWKQRSAV